MNSIKTAQCFKLQVKASAVEVIVGMLSSVERKKGKREDEGGSRSREPARPAAQKQKGSCMRSI